MGMSYSSGIQQDRMNCPTESEGSFCHLPGKTLDALDQIRLSSKVARGEFLFTERGAPRGVFILSKGRVKLSITSSDGKSVILRIAKPGEVLGLHAVVSDQPYHASAEAMEPCEVSFVRREDFLDFLRENPEASLRTAQQLSEHYHLACEQVRSVTLTHSATGKLAGLLLESAAKGQPTTRGIRVSLPLTHEEIGQMIGVSRETVTRAFSDFKRRQFLAGRGTAIFIQNRHALERFAGV